MRKYLAEVEAPNINLATGKSYDSDFESVLPGYDVLDPRVNHHLNGVQFKLSGDGQGVMGEVRLVNQQFGIYG